MNNIRKYLIEGIVVALVLVVLLVVMIPRFRNAQVRAKIAKIIHNLEQTRNAINAYSLDHSGYPRNDILNNSLPTSAGQASLINFYALTTPTSYINNPAFLLDPYSDKVSDQFLNFLPVKDIMSKKWLVNEEFIVENPVYLLFSVGVSGVMPKSLKIGRQKANTEYVLFDNMYSPSNGVLSSGVLYATDQGVIPVE